MRVAKLATIGIAAVLVLSACSSSKVGSAAYVSSTEISDTTVDSYVTKAGPSPTPTPTSDTPVTKGPSTRVTTLQFLIQNELFTQALAATGDAPTASQLSAAHDDAITFLQPNVTLRGDAYDAALTKEVAALGYETSFVDVVVQNVELEYLYIQRSKVTSPDELAASITKLNLPVDVSTKYGAWIPSALSLDSSPSAGLPTFVSLAPAPVASAATG